MFFQGTDLHRIDHIRVYFNIMRREFWIRRVVVQKHSCITRHIVYFIILHSFDLKGYWIYKVLRFLVKLLKISIIISYPISVLIKTSYQPIGLYEINQTFQSLLRSFINSTLGWFSADLLTERQQANHLEQNIGLC